ncbi:Hypothetical protein, putative [Bodo saltans]|uniref:NUC153 domain-containing protein n=1 Tax=Bodo saltans TaxID=75058 RepID=A0A0S4JNM6_BODSA|nr:Hypothetical protein, putative [Bodo saltans]|eukprot:CUG93113.1 Hypothetical protein, putative [Bodo saltans]
MQVAIHNKVKVYNLTSGKSLPEWLEERKRNKKLAGGEHRIELIHDLEFPHFSRCIFRTQNGTHLFAAGDYPPRLKCFDVNELSMKYSFNADMPILGGVALSSDFRKFALRGEGRQITVHHSASIIDRVRVPHAQRCLSYHDYNAELLSSGTSHEIFRFNLESGAFVESYKTNSDDGVNCVEYFRGNGLVMAACANGTMEAWDHRAARQAAVLQVAGAASSGLTTSMELTHVSTDDNGLLFACGTDKGNVLLYDMRLNRPLVSKDHMNALPIVKTYFFRGRDGTSSGESTHIVSADTRSVKVWNKRDGSNFTTLETPADIYDFTFLKAQHNMVSPFESDDSGIICICCDTPRVQVHFIPQLGIAPRWASFLDSITEELEEKEQSVVYDDYKFISKEEMDTLGLEPQDLARGKVRPAMHGCYIENSLYRELKAVVDPNAFNRFAVESKQKKVAERWENRISKFKRVDPEEDQEKNALSAITADPRFAGKLSANLAAFAVDKKNPEFQKLIKKIENRQDKAAARRQRYDDDMFRIVPDTDAAGADGTDGPARDEVDEIAKRELGRNVASNRREEASKRKENSAAAAAEQRKVVMFEAKEGANFTATERQTHEQRKRDRSAKLSLEERMKKINRK